MKQNNWLARWIILSGAGLLLARNRFFGLSPFVIAYVTLLFYFAGDLTFKGIKRYGGILLCSVLMGLITRFYILTAVRYAVSMFFCAGLVTLFRKRAKNVPTIGIALCALAGGFVGAAFSTVFWGDFGRGGILWVLEGLFSFFMVFLFDGGIRYFLLVPERENEELSIGNVLRLKRRRLGYEELLSIMLILSLVLMGLPKVTVYGVDLVSSLRFFFILIAAYLYGAGAGGISGMVTGFLLVLESFMGNADYKGILTGLLSFEKSNGQILLLCLCGIMAGVGREFSKLMSVLGFLVTGTAFYYLGNQDVITPFQLFEICIAAVGFLLIPVRYLSPDFGMEEIGGKGAQGSRQTYRECFQGIIRDRIQGYSKAFTRLGRSFLSLSEEAQEIGFPDAVALVEGVSGKICGNCSFFNNCVTRTQRGNLETSVEILRSAVLEEGVGRDCLSDEFLEGCVHADEYINAVDREILLARMNIKWHNNMAKTREAIASQMEEMSHIMDRLSKETMGFEEIYLFDVERLRFMLRRQYIELGQVVCLKTKDGYREVHLFARAVRGFVLTTKELAEFIGKQCKIPLKAFGSTRNVIDSSFEKISLREDTRYGILMGIARCTKKEEAVSGDSFSCMNLESGKAVLSISDGMGSGKRAFEESQAIMDLTEEMLEAGFGHETTIRLIHSILMEHPEKQSFSTLDLCMVDLYTADMEIMKIGGAPTFIKRGQRVETIEAATLPMGILDQMELASMRRKLYDKDIIVMVSDGVLDGIGRMFPDEERTDRLAQEIANLYSGIPKDMAKSLLRLAGGDKGVRDDMTILVASLYEKRKE